MVSVVLLAETYGARESVGFALPLLLLADFMAYPAFINHGSWREVWKIMPPAIVGIAIGWALLGVVDDQLARRLIGSCVLVMVVLQVTRRVASERFDRFADSRSFGIGTGVLAGFSTTLANAAGPVVQLYLLARRTPKMEMVGIAARMFLLMNLIKLPLNAQLSLIDRASLLANAKLAPVILIGIIGGRELVNRVPQRGFEWMIIAFSAAAAARLLW